MQRFMAALKLAFDSKSTRLDIVAGQKISTESPAGRQEHEAVLDPALVGGIILNLFQNKMPAQPERTKLSIKGVGEFPVLVFPAEKKLSVFFGPEGLQLFNKSWTDLQSAAPAGAPKPAAAKAAAPAPTPLAAQPIEKKPVVQAAPPPMIEEPVADISEDQSASEQTPDEAIAFDAAEVAAESALEEAAPAEVEEIDLLADNSDSNETESVAEEIKAPPPAKAEKAAAAPAAAAAVQQSDRLTSLEDAFDSGAFNEAHAKSKNHDDEEEDPAPTKTRANRASPAGGHATSEMMMESSEEEVPEEKIFFGANKPGMSSVSDGENEIDDILKLMFTKKASDLHLAIGNRVMFRIDGEIERIGEEIIDEKRMEELLVPIMPKMNYAEFAKDNDSDFAYEIRGISRFRVNLFRDHQGVGCIMRIIPQKILTLEDLGCPPVFLEFAKLSKGLVLVTGPTGSGKSTTLAAIIDWINKNRPEHIITIEDPVEFTHQQHMCTITHREVGKHTNSFKRALRGALRQDPDIVLVGELRDLETVAIAIETAETGHLVFGTLHTNTAISTVDRIIDQFPSEQQGQIRMMLSNSLKGVIAQCLVKKIGGGRVAAHEILYVNDAVANLVREGKTHMIGGVMQGQKQFGNVLMDDSLMKFVLNKSISPEDAFIKSIRKQDFKEELTARGIKLDMSQVGDADPDHKPSLDGSKPGDGGKPKAGAPPPGGKQPIKKAS